MNSSPSSVGSASAWVVTSRGVILIAVDRNFINNAGASALTPGHSSRSIPKMPPTRRQRRRATHSTSIYNNAYDVAVGTFAKPMPFSNAFVYAHSPVLTPPTEGGGTREPTAPNGPSVGSAGLIYASDMSGGTLRTTPFAGAGLGATSLGTGVLYTDPRFDQNSYASTAAVTQLTRGAH